MYIINNLNTLFKDISGFFKGESYIQEGVEFALELKKSYICKFVESSDSILFFVNNINVFSLSFKDLESNLNSFLFSFWDFILEHFSYKEHMEGIPLKNIYSGQLVYFYNNQLIQVQLTDYLSTRSNQPFFFINRITKLNNIIRHYSQDNKFFIENEFEGKIEKYEFFH